MINYINLSKSEIVPLPYLSDEEYLNRFNKGWSYSYVYHFNEIRNIYILVKKFGFHDLQTFFNKCLQFKLPTYKTPWNERRILENLNALKNFGLLSDNYDIIRDDIFLEDDLELEISIADINIFRDIYFNYYRFRELHSWFIDPLNKNREEIILNISKEVLENKSFSIFPFSTNTRFTDSIIYQLKDNAPIFKFSNTAIGNGDVMRFWDVFIKWGIKLDLIEKFNLKNLDFQLAEKYKSLTCVYFKRKIDPDFDLLAYLVRNYNTDYINIPKLVFRLATVFRFSISDIKTLIVNVSNANRDKMSLQRTSEIFIRDTEINFVPKVNDSYISHILLTNGTRKSH